MKAIENFCLDNKIIKRDGSPDLPQFGRDAGLGYDVFYKIRTTGKAPSETNQIKLLSFTGLYYIDLFYMEDPMKGGEVH